MPLSEPLSSVREAPTLLAHQPFAWDGSELQARSAGWIVDLGSAISTPDLQSFLRRNSPLWRERSDVGCPAPLQEICSRLRDILFKETGVALVRCGQNLTPNEARLLQLVLGCVFGVNITRTPGSDDRPLFALEASQDPTANSKYSGNGLRSNTIGFHTDGSGCGDRDVEVLSLLCIRPARFGGQSRVANAQLARASLSSSTREVLASAFARENPFAPSSAATSLKTAPIYCEAVKEGVTHFRFSYHPQRVRNAFCGQFERFPATVAALTELDEALERFSCDINLGVNEIIFVNNWAIAHDRRAFIDDPRAKRLLERFWAGTFTMAGVAGRGYEHCALPACVGM